MCMCVRARPRSLTVLCFAVTSQDWPFDDGQAPPQEVMENWFNLLKTRFNEDPNCCIAVHCVAGLGRSVSASPPCGLV